MEHAQAIAALLRSQAELQRSQAELQDVMQEFVKKMNLDAATPRAPGEILAQLATEEDIEAYLEVFERAAGRERWAPEDWGSILGPFLTGEALKACMEMNADDARDYTKLKAAILARQGQSLPARAQRFHNWTYQPTQPARPQVAALRRLGRSWLMSPGGPDCVDRLVIDKCIRAVPPDARKYTAQVRPSSVDELIDLLENHQVCLDMLKGTSKIDPPRPGGEERSGREKRRQNTGPPSTPSRQDERAGRPPARRCYVCGKVDHLSWSCPDRDVSMATAASDAAKPSLYGNTTKKKQTSVPAKVDGKDTHALLDSGSVVTLVSPAFAGPLERGTVPVTCVHGDVKHYPTSSIRIQTPRGSATVMAGVVPGLPVPLLLGVDCSIFERYWNPADPAPRTRGKRRKRRPAGRTRDPRPAYPVFQDSSADVRSDSSPAYEPANEMDEGPPAEEDAGEEEDPFMEFPPADAEAPTRYGEFATQQWADPNLEAARQRVAEIDGQSGGAVSDKSFPYFVVKRGLLYRVVKKQGEEIIEQLLIPKSYVSRVLYLAHTHQLGAHLGVEKTYERILARFYWPGIKRAVEDFCRACHECQLVAPKPHYRNPLIPMPIIDVPFERLAMDIVGPLPKSARGHRYILVIMDYATRYPEAIPLRAASSRAIAHELLMMFSRVGIAKEILSDQGTCFMATVLKHLYKWLNVKSIRTSVYHPQTDGLVERFNKTLKQMLKKVAETDGKDWDRLIPYVLFSIREVPQASTGFSPFELVYGRRPRGLLDIAKDAWESQPSPHRSVIDHVQQLQARARKIWPLVREHMKEAQRDQARIYNRGAAVREFNPGEQVLVLVPTSECKFLARWQGPYEITDKVGPVTYRVSQPGKRKAHQIYHVNILKKWHAPEPLPVNALLTVMSPQVSPPVPIGDELSPRQVQEVRELLNRCNDRFSELPGRTHLASHDIDTKPGVVVRQRPYRVPEARRKAIKEEVEKMLALDVIEESYSPWSSPIVIVPKPDGTLRFCNDFRKLNEVSNFDCYPMARVDEMTERLGPARFISTLDLTKGYWQIPLTDRARPKTAFSTPDGLFQYKVLPFGVHGAPATFQRLMDKILRPHQDYAGAYIDDVIIYSRSWQEHLRHLEAVLDELRSANLTVNAKKCRVGMTETDFLGFTVGRGCIKPQERKVQRIKEWPRPITKRQVKSFLGLLSYYQKFIDNYSTVAAPLYDLTRQREPHHVKWTIETEEAFTLLKEAMCHQPVLITPDFNHPFLLHTDASGTGIGAVLSQVINGEEHPITFISRKLLKHERNYATVEKECLAIKWAIHHLRYYLWGRQFTLITDHAPLKWMATNKDKNSRVTRWFIDLQNYKFKVEHRPGKAIPHADALSRLHETGGDDDVSRPGVKHRGGMCGVSARGRAPRGSLLGERERVTGRARRCQRQRGRVVDGRYIPPRLLVCLNQTPAVRPHPARTKTHAFALLTLSETLTRDRLACGSR